jgi:hypothetical protein
MSTALKNQHGQMESSTSATASATRQLRVSYASATLAIPREETLPSFQKYYFNERMIRTLQRESGLGELQYRLHQIYFVNEFSRRELNQELSIRQLSQAFGCDGARIKAALANRLNDLKICGH